MPFYENPRSKMKFRAGCKEFNWAIPVDMGESLAFQFPVRQGLATGYTWQLMDEDDNDLVSLASGSLLYTEDTDGNAWLSYHGDLAYLNELDCGVYSFRVNTPRNVTLAYSEQFRVMNIGERERAYKLTFSHDTDIDGIIYQGGYEQKVWLLDCVFDTPEIVEQTDNATDGDAVEVLTFQSIQRREVLRFPYFPDYWQGVFHRLRKMDNLTIEKLETAQSWDIAESALAFTTEEQDVCFKKGVLSFLGSTQVIGDCEENRELVYLNSVPT